MLAGFPSHVYTVTEPRIFGVSEGIDRGVRILETDKQIVKGLLKLLSGNKLNLTTTLMVGQIYADD